ncbi:MAG: chromosome segregation protein SMC [Tissierellia bacterium]|nr:chromosome segregation protein SMC [Tissierellia bacterium]
MYLKSIELQGFKSFPKKTTINFEQGVTAIVGPNGSGKSNISDAIKWVLGEQSLKTLRGQKTEDIIFSGTDKRRPLNFTQVSITFDNEDEALPVEFSEVVVTRRAFRHGENEYLINQRNVRLKDVRQLFMDTGFGKDGYALIGQGQIDSILSESGQERKNLFDEAAGISRVKYEKEESERNLRRVSEQLLRIQDMHYATERFVTQLAREAEEAKLYINRYNEIKELHMQFAYHRTNVLNIRKAELLNKKSELDQAIAEADESIVNINNYISNLEREIADVEEQLKEEQNALVEATKDLEQQRGEHKVARARFEDWKREIERLTEQLRSYEAQRQALLSIEIAEVDNVALDKQLHDLEEAFNASRDKVIECQSLLESLKLKRVSLINDQRDAEERRWQRELAIQRLNDSLMQAEELERKAGEDLKIKESELEITKAKIKSKNSEKKELEKRKNSIEEILENVTENLAKNEIKRDDLRSEKINLESNLAKASASYQVYINSKEDYQGYAKSVQQLMHTIDRNRFGIIDTVAEIIDVEEQYVKAMEVALGYGMQNVIMNNAEDIKTLLPEIKNRGIGRVTFLPLQTIKGFNSKKLIELPQGCLGLASDIIKYDIKYKNIISHLLRDTLIFDSYSNALKYAKISGFSRKMVTLSGELISAGGAITVGSMKSDNTVLRIGAKLKKLEMEINSIEQSLKIINENVLKLDDIISVEANAINSKNIDHDSIVLELETVNRELFIYEQNKNSLLSYLEEAKASINEISEKKSNIAVELESNGDFSGDIVINMGNIEEQISEKEIELDNLRICSDDKQKLYYEGKESIGLQRFEWENRNSKLSQIMEFKEVASRDKEDLINRLSTLEKDLESIHSKETVYLSKTNELQENINTARDEQYMNRLKLKELSEERNDWENKKHQFNIQMVSLEGKEEQLILELKNIKNEVMEQYNVDVDSWEDNGTKVTSKELKEKQIELDKMGSVNVASIHRYDEEKAEFDKLEAQRLDLEESKGKLTKLITKMDKEMSERFNESLKSISKYFNEAFVELFDGGRAELQYEILGEGEEGQVNILCQPPGKKLQHLNLLSGGEKSLTAVALVFALMHERPSPFCILDEIDAALDEANIMRYTNYLNKLNENTQFIIITHRKATMEIANTIYGITMEQKGISKIIEMPMEGIH